MHHAGHRDAVCYTRNDILTRYSQKIKRRPAPQLLDKRRRHQRVANHLIINGVDDLENSPGERERTKKRKRCTRKREKRDINYRRRRIRPWRIVRINRNEINREERKTTKLNPKNHLFVFSFFFFLVIATICDYLRSRKLTRKYPTISCVFFFFFYFIFIF